MRNQVNIRPSIRGKSKSKISQSRLLLTLTHAAGDQIKAMIFNIRKGLDIVLTTAPQLTKPERWTALVRYIVAKIIAAAPKIHPPPTNAPQIAAPLAVG